jgi:hypothetical protein
LCATCLATIAEPSTRHRRNYQPIAIFIQSTIGFLILWIVFYYAGQILLSIPVEMHEGTTWSDFLK